MPPISFRNCIYLDHHATTPMDERVFLKIKPFFMESYGNPHSNAHPYGWHGEDAVMDARIQVAKAINAHPTEVIFTSGATESTNMALKGLFFEPQQKKTHIVSSSIEHSATLMTLAALSEHKASITLLKPTPLGLITESSLRDAITNNTAVVSLIMVHNEVGSINAIEKLAALAHDHGALFHCDAVQALGRIPIDCQAMNIDMMSLSGHKIYGPKGVGCLYIRRQIMENICPLIHGGGQEWHKRSGTLNVPGIVGMGEACRLAVLDIDQENKRIKALRDGLLAHLQVLDGVHINGTMVERVSGNLNVSFAGIDGEELMLAICKRIALSTGSACSQASGMPHRVLSEMGISPELRQASLRFGLGRFTTMSEIDEAAELIVSEVKRLRMTKKQAKPVVKIMRHNNNGSS